MSGGASAARRNAAGKISRVCPCGKTVYGNGRAHQRTCSAWLSLNGWPMDEGMADAVRQDYGGGVVAGVQQRLGKLYLERRAAGDKTALPWKEYRDRVWEFAELTVNGVTTSRQLTMDELHVIDGLKGKWGEQFAGYETDETSIIVRAKTGHAIRVTITPTEGS